MRVKEEREKAGLKLNIQKANIMGLSPITSWQVEEEKVEMRQILFYWTRKSLQMVTEVMKLKDLFLGRKAMSNLDSVLNNRDVHIVKAIVFPVVMY